MINLKILWNVLNRNVFFFVNLSVFARDPLRSHTSMNLRKMKFISKLNFYHIGWHPIYLFMSNSVYVQHYSLFLNVVIITNFRQPAW